MHIRFDDRFNEYLKLADEAADARTIWKKTTLTQAYVNLKHGILQSARDTMNTTTSPEEHMSAFGTFYSQNASKYGEILATLGFRDDAHAKSASITHQDMFDARDSGIPISHESRKIDRAARKYLNGSASIRLMTATRIAADVILDTVMTFDTTPPRTTTTTSGRNTKTTSVATERECAVCYDDKNVDEFWLLHAPNPGKTDKIHTCNAANTDDNVCHYICKTCTNKISGKRWLCPLCSVPITLVPARGPDDDNTRVRFDFMETFTFTPYTDVNQTYNVTIYAPSQKDTVNKTHGIVCFRIAHPVNDAEPLYATFELPLVTAMEYWNPQPYERDTTPIQFSKMHDGVHLSATHNGVPLVLSTNERSGELSVYVDRIGNSTRRTSVHTTRGRENGPVSGPTSGRVTQSLRNQFMTWGNSPRHARVHGAATGATSGSLTGGNSARKRGPTYTNTGRKVVVKGGTAKKAVYSKGGKFFVREMKAGPDGSKRAVYMPLP
jgi:hypothetical protein